MKKLPAFFRDYLVFRWLEKIDVGIVFLFSVIEKSMINVIYDFEVGDRPWILSRNFTVKGNELLPLVKPSSGNQINRHTFHDRSKVVILSEQFGEL